MNAQNFIVKNHTSKYRSYIDEGSTRGAKPELKHYRLLNLKP